MAVNATPPIPKSSPDVAKLNSFSGHTVTVTKYQSLRGVGQMVLSTQPMGLKQILELQVSLPIQEGPGLYKFQVVDTGGIADDEWLVKLGPDQQEGSMSGPGFPPPPGGPGAPLVFGPTPDGLQQLGRGYFYNAEMGTLNTPWGELVEWRPGQTLPRAPTNASHLSLVPPNAQPGWSPVPGWGSFPATDDTRALKEIEQRLATEQRQRDREDDNRRRQEEKDERRRDQEEQRRRDDARDAQMVELFKALTAKPAGPSDSELTLRREIEETRRRLEEQTREETRRREDQAREDRYRADLRAQQEKTDMMLREIREKDANRPDPMVALMTTLMTGSQAQATESVRAVREASQATTTASERHTLQLVDAMRQDKTGAAEMSRAALENAKTMLDMQSSIFHQALEMQNSGGQPWYATAIQGALEKLGPVVQAVANRPQVAQSQYAPPARATAPRHVAPGTTRPIPTTATAASSIPGVPPRVETGDRPEGVEFDTESNTFVIPGGPGHPGYRVPVAFVQEHGWNETLKRLAQQSAPSPVAAFAGAAASPVAAAPAAAGATVTPITPITTAKPKRGGRAPKVQPPATPAPEVPTVVVPPPADAAKGYNRDELRALDYDQMLAIVAPFDDPTFFGDLWPYVQQLRTTPTTPEKVAEYVLQGKAQLQSAGKSVPATDVLEAEQIDALVERLFPGAPDDYAEAVAKALATAMGLEVLEDDA